MSVLSGEAHGVGQDLLFTHLSFADQGIMRTPELHEGPRVRAKRAKSYIGAVNDGIRLDRERAAKDDKREPSLTFNPSKEIDPSLEAMVLEGQDETATDTQLPSDLATSEEVNEEKDVPEASATKSLKSWEAASLAEQRARRAARGSVSPGSQPLPSSHQLRQDLTALLRAQSKVQGRPPPR